MDKVCIFRSINLFFVLADVLDKVLVYHSMKRRCLIFANKRAICGSDLLEAGENVDDVSELISMQVSINRVNKTGQEVFHDLEICFVFNKGNSRA